MKKIISFILVLTLAVISLVSCEGGASNHDHVYGEEWQKDSDYHWHACTAVDGCTNQGEKALHDYDIIIDENDKLINKCKVCGHTNEKVSTAPEHEHTFADKYSQSENFHWHECTVEGCYEADKSDAHQYGNPEISYEDQYLVMKYTCVDCEYIKTEKQKIDATIETADEWDNIFEYMEFINFSMKVTHGSKSNPEMVNYCVVTENGAYYYLPGWEEEYYSVKDENGKYSGYHRSDEHGFISLSEEDSEEFHKMATRETVLQISFAENFDKFEYNAETGTYYSEEIISAIYYDYEGQPYGTLYCTKSEIKVADGKIIHIACDYYLEENPSYEHSFIYYNIGMSEVKVPLSVIEEANRNAENQ